MNNKRLAATVLSVAAMITSCSTDYSNDSGDSDTGGAAGNPGLGIGGATSIGGTASVGGASSGGAPGATCGNGVVEDGETCDPPTSCPASCDDGDACTVDQMTGSAANCNVDCSHTTIGSCSPGDGCCPPGCEGTADTDCGTTGAGGAVTGAGGSVTGAGGSVTGTGGSVTGAGGDGSGGLVTGSGGDGSGGLVTGSGGSAGDGTGGEGTGGEGTGGEGTGGEGTGGTIVLSERPCDIYANNGNPCVAAYSMVRVLARDYTGPLYQVRRGAPSPYENTGYGGETQDIGFDENGYADAAAQDAFCAGTTCTVSVLYDQSPMGNDLRRGNAGCYTGGDGSAAEDDYESDATAQPLTVGGHDVYALYTNVHEGYRNNDAVGTAVGTESQGIYMVADGTHYGNPCCFDFGNASRDSCFGPTGIMNALMLGTGFWGMGEGPGPWMMADFELGVWAGGYHGIWPGMADYINDYVPPGEDPITLAGTEVPEDEILWEQNLSMNYPYVFGALTSEYVQAEGRSHYAIRSGNATAGNTLATAYDGWTEIEFVLEGAIILGIGGDNSNWSWGTFYEGAMTAGRPTAATDQAVYANVQAAGYGQ